MSKVNYLVGRLCKQKGIKELTIEEMPMDHLFMAFRSQDTDEQRRMLKENKVTALTKAFAESLHAGRTVVVRDPTDLQVYFVKAYEDELVAVTQPLGPWFDIYSARSSSPDLLIELGITTNTFKDHLILDGIFNFPLEGKGIQETIQPEYLEQPAPDSIWFAPVQRKVSPEERQRRTDLAEQEISRAMETIIAAVGTIEESSDVNVDELMGTQMAKAFDKLNKTQAAKHAAKQAAVGKSKPVSHTDEATTEIRRVDLTRA